MSDRLEDGDRVIRDAVEASEEQYKSINEYIPDYDDFVLTDSVAKWLNHYTGQTHSESTIQNKVHHTSLFSEWALETNQEPMDLKPVEIEDFLSACHLSPSSMPGVYTSLNIYYDYLEKIDLVEENPAADADLSSYKGDPLKTDGESEDLHYATRSDIKYLTENLGKPRYRNEMIIRLLWQTGIRAEEAETIETSDIDHENQSITVNSSKTGNTRDVYYRRSLGVLLSHWVNNLRESMTPSADSDRLLISNQYPSLSTSAIQRVVRDAAGDPHDPDTPQEIVATDAGGSPEFRITPHSIRAGFAVRCVKNGMDIRRLRDLLGHSTIDTTEIYLKFGDKDVEKAARTYAPTSP